MPELLLLGESHAPSSLIRKQAGLLLSFIQCHRLQQGPRALPSPLASSTRPSILPLIRGDKIMSRQVVLFLKKNFQFCVGE